MTSSADTYGGFPVLAYPPVVGAAFLVLYVTFLLVIRLVDSYRYSVEDMRRDLLDTRLKETLQNLFSLMDDTGSQKSRCFPCLKKRYTKVVPTISALTTLNKFGEAKDADADEVLKRNLLVSTVVKELQDIIRVLARILAGRRKVSEWKIPLLSWNGRDYLLSLISLDSSLDSAKRKHLVSVPLSISHIREKLCEGRDEEASEGAQLEIAAFEGAQLAIVYKAIQAVQAKLVMRWNISLQILKTTAYAFLTLLTFYYTESLTSDYAVSCLVLYIAAADTISNVSTTSLANFVIPELSAGMGNLVREIELRLKSMALNKEQEVNDWLKTYFDEYNTMQQFLRDDYTAYRGRTIEKAGFDLVNAVS